MVKYELMNILLQDFPEGIVITMACFALLKLRFDWKKILMISVLWALTNMVRHLPIAFGVHTIILTITLTIYLRFFTGAKLVDIFKATTLCLLIIVILQVTYTKPLFGVLEFSFDGFLTEPFYRALLTLPYEIFLFVLALVLNYKNKKVSNIMDSKLEFSRYGVDKETTKIV